VRVLLVVNAAASSVTPRRRVLVNKVLAAEHDVEVLATTARGHATDLARRAVSDGVDCVVVLGGDGTLNEVATALTGTSCALAALPGGSTNVFARTLGLPEDTVRAASVIATSLSAGSIRSIGLGEVNGRAFTFHTGIGWDAALVAEVERHGRLKRYATHALYVYAGLRTFAGSYDRVHPHFEVTFGDGTGPSDTIEDAFFTLVQNSDPYTFVGGRPFVVSPAADLHRPFSVTTLRSMSAGTFARVMADALRGGGVRPGRSVDVRTDVTELSVQRRTTMPYQVDGDHMGQADRLTLVHRPDAVRLVVPAVVGDRGAGAAHVRPSA
jgi:diacylglycerol kinase family enzyme